MIVVFTMHFFLFLGICIYHVGQTLLVKKFEVTQNRSFDAMDDVISRKKLSEFGNLALIEDREDPRGKTAIKYEEISSVGN